MRDILFRAKSVINGEWVEGYFCMATIGGKEVSLIIPHGAFVDWTISRNIYQVVPETVGQYTGLTDKNGVKIFEGDIVKYGDTVHLVVFEQRNGTAYFGLVYSEIETLPFGHYQDSRRIEVIGNIYDNPELLEVAKND